MIICKAKEEGKNNIKRNVFDLLMTESRELLVL